MTESYPDEDVAKFSVTDFKNLEPGRDYFVQAWTEKGESIEYQPKSITFDNKNKKHPSNITPGKDITLPGKIRAVFVGLTKESEPVVMDKKTGTYRTIPVNLFKEGIIKIK